MNLWILIGIVIIVVGFSLKLDVLAVVLTAGIATGIAAKMNFFEILGLIGKAFVDNRLMSIFLISLPVIAVLERYGLRERSAALIEKLKNAPTPGTRIRLRKEIRLLNQALGLEENADIPTPQPSKESIERQRRIKEREIEEAKKEKEMAENLKEFENKGYIKIENNFAIYQLKGIFWGNSLVADIIELIGGNL